MSQWLDGALPGRRRKAVTEGFKGLSTFCHTAASVCTEVETPVIRTVLRLKEEEEEVPRKSEIGQEAKYLLRVQ